MVTAGAPALLMVLTGVPVGIRAGVFGVAPVVVCSAGTVRFIGLGASARGAPRRGHNGMGRYGSVSSFRWPSGPGLLAEIPRVRPSGPPGYARQPEETSPARRPRLPHSSLRLPHADRSSHSPPRMTIIRRS